MLQKFTVYTVILMLNYAVGLAVDWINDKVYWADRDLKSIFVYDLNTQQTSKFTDINGDGIPTKLRILPQPNNGYVV